MRPAISPPRSWAERIRGLAPVLPTPWSSGSWRRVMRLGDWAPTGRTEVPHLCRVRPVGPPHPRARSKRKGESEVGKGDAVRDSMLDLAERLAQLDDEKWNSPSLCAEWRVRDVVAHLIAGAEGAFGIGWALRSIVRQGFNYNRWVAADAQRRGQHDPGVLLDALR